MTILLYDLCGRDRDLRFSPYCWRAKMALAHKGLPFETIATSFTGLSGVEGGASKLVPVINDAGRIVQDSFEIALYLDRQYPDRPALFDGEAAIASARFLESWAFLTVHPVSMRMMVKDIHDLLGEADQTYFRSSREARLGRRLEEHQTGVDANLEALAAVLEPVRRTLARHPWLGGAAPNFSDYVLCGTFMWMRAVLGRLPLPADDAVTGWFEHCLALHSGLGREARVSAA
jgi:glutathione S-transferase